MHRRWKAAAAALVTALAITTPALGAQVEVDGIPLTTDQAWISGGTSYITLRAYAALTGASLTWDGRQAILEGEELLLQAQPGEIYLTANQRPLYIAGGVLVVDGKMALPLRTVAQATGAQLTWDAQRGTAVLNTEGAVPARADYDEEELDWLARIISAESRGEPLLGQIAVGNVVLNRVADSRYPDTIQGVILDDNYGIQFEPVANGTVYQEPTQSAVLAAKLCLEGASVVGDSLYFFAPALSPGTWIVNNCTYVTTIGCHQFYR